jgi:hypothetical protein
MIIRVKDMSNFDFSKAFLREIGRNAGKGVFYAHISNTGRRTALAINIMFCK